jgi:manganese/iron transport system ATP-binding protein
VSGSAPQSHICIAYVPQRSQVDWSFPVTVSVVVMMGRSGKLGLLRRPRRADWAYVRECLDVVRLGHLADQQIGNLSGGQQQRMFIARALAQEAELMLMDEPLSGLDLPALDDVFQVLDVLHERGVTVMVALHDLQLAAQRFDRVMLLNRRALGFGPPAQVFTPELLMRAYGGHIHLTPGAEGILVLDDACCEDGADVHA